MNLAAKARSDEELCGVINNFWRERGFEARARVEMHSYKVPARTVMSAGGEATHFPTSDFNRREIVSDLVNGGPRRVTASSREEAPADHTP
jgi:hypothetical protein